MERREAPAFPKGTRQDGRLVRHPALHPLALCEGEKLVPAKAGKTTAYPAPQRIRVAERWLLSPPHPEEGPKGASPRMMAASWFETRRCAALLTTRIKVAI
jgi:hypothetical protein